MKYTIIGDPHAKHDNLDKLAKLCDLVEAKGQTCVWLGDMLDTKEIIRGKCMNHWVRYFSDSQLEHIVIVGNHDWFNLECEDHALIPLAELPNVTVVDDLYLLGDNMFAIPYIHDQKELKTTLKELPDDAILFGHLELKDFDFGNGHMCDEGLTKRSFKRFKKVITGHFHKYQSTDNVTYLGTPFSLNFGESNQVKYIADFDTVTGDLDLIETDFPRHLTIEHDCDSGEPLPEINPDDIVRIVLKGSQEAIQKFDQSKMPEGTKIVTKATKSAKLDETVSEHFTNTQQFFHWATSIKSLEEQTVVLGKQILEEVGAN